jgi:hypothetical protein
LDAAFAAQEAEETAALFARDLIVNAPSNRVARRDAVLVFFKAGRMDYESGTSTIEALEARGDHVVMMGEEVVKPNETAPNPGKTVRRRFHGCLAQRIRRPMATDNSAGYDHFCGMRFESLRGSSN